MEPLTRRQHGLLLCLLVPVLATVASHVVFYRRFPGQADYHFPRAYFLTVATVILSCWTLNVGIFRLLDQRLPFHAHPTRRILRQIGLGVPSTMATFFVVFPGAIRLYTGTWPSSTQLVSGIFVCLTIAALINGGYMGLYLLQAFRHAKQPAAQKLTPELTARQPAGRSTNTVSSAILIDFGSKQVQLQPQGIAYFYSTQGVVFLVKVDGQRLTTNYNSFAKLAGRLSDDLFFQLNRQVIVSLRAIRSVEDAANRKLRISLTPALPGEAMVTVSRYRNSAFSRWFRPVGSARPLVNGIDTIH